MWAANKLDLPGPLVWPFENMANQPPKYASTIPFQAAAPVGPYSPQTGPYKVQNPTPYSPQPGLYQGPNSHSPMPSAASPSSNPYSFPPASHQSQSFQPSMMPICPNSNLSRRIESTYTACPHCKHIGFTTVEIRNNSILMAIGLSFFFLTVLILIFSYNILLSAICFWSGMFLLCFFQSRHHSCSKCKVSIARIFSCGFCCC